MPKTLFNIHVYLVDNLFYIVPLLKQPNGTWVEVQPMLNSKKDATELGDVLRELRSLSVDSLATSQWWNGNDGTIWSNATQLWSVYWRDDGSVAIVPKYHRPTTTDPETGDVLDGGWADNNEQKVILFNNTSFQQIAQIIADLAESIDG